MAITDEQIEQLNAKLDPKRVKKPSGNFGPKGDYIEGWDAVDTANQIFGFDGWCHEIRTMDLIEDSERPKNDKMMSVVSYKSVVRVTVDFGGKQVFRDGVGYGSGYSNTGRGDAHESAMKEAETDAKKRALMNFGNQFGLALYDKKRANVGVEAKAKPKTKPKDESEEKPSKKESGDQTLEKSKALANEIKSASSISQVNKIEQKLNGLYGNDIRMSNPQHFDRLQELLQQRLLFLQQQGSGQQDRDPADELVA